MLLDRSAQAASIATAREVRRILGRLTGRPSAIIPVFKMRPRLASQDVVRRVEATAIESCRVPATADRPQAGKYGNSTARGSLIIVHLV